MVIFREDIMAKCNPPKSISQAGKDLQNPNSTKKKKSDAGEKLADHKNKKH